MMHYVFLQYVLSIVHSFCIFASCNLEMLSIAYMPICTVVSATIEARIILILVLQPRNEFGLDKSFVPILALDCFVL